MCQCCNTPIVGRGYGIQEITVCHWCYEHCDEHHQTYPHQWDEGGEA